ncbi:glycosyltransferase family 4 protein [Ligilactobacillus sp. LYQ135]
MLNIHMYSSALSVKGQGVGSAYSELIRLLQERFPDKIKIVINKLGKADISHYHTIDPLFYLETFLPGRGVKVGYVHFLPETIEGSLNLPWIAKKVFYKYMISFYKRMDQIVVVNPVFGKKLEKYGIPSEKIMYIPNFVSKKEFYPQNLAKKKQTRAKLGIEEQKFTVIGVGQVQERKGVPDFIELARRHPEIEFIWAGGFSFGKMTDGYSELKKVVDNPPANLIFPGILDRSEMNDYYNAADLFLLPSYNELFPMSVLEAFNVGLPVMLRDLDLYKAIIKGYYQGAKNVDEMDQQLVRLSNDQKALADLKNKSQMGANYYSEERLAQIWLDYYTSLIKD